MKLRGRVIKGLGLGTKLGYPTANLKCTSVKYPTPGVYAARATCAGATYNAAAVIGARTEKDKPLIEVHFLYFQDDLYGQVLTVEVLKRISQIMPLSNPRALKKKIEQDIKKIKRWFNKSVLY